MSFVTKISADAFNNMAYDSGMWLNKFDVESPKTPEDKDIICTTTGDITINCEATYENIAEDVNNVHGDFKEFQILTGWSVTTDFTALEATPEVLKMGFGAADIDRNKVTPRNELKQEDFVDRYWVAKTLGGGLVVAHLMNTLSTSGISLTSTKDGKANLGVNLKAFASLENQEVVPVEFYVISEETVNGDG